MLPPSQTLPTIDNLIRLREIFKVTIDEMVSDEKERVWEQESVFEKKDIDRMWRKRLLSHLLSLLPSLLCWGAAIVLFCMQDLPSAFLGFLVGALFVDTVFCTKQLFSKILKEKKSTLGLLHKTMKLDVYKDTATVTLLLDGELLWRVDFALNGVGVKELSDEFAAVKEYGMLLVFRDVILKDSKLIQEFVK